ncbi:hypothetical protein HDV05_004793 [Chytridiales sp. JEL 0842]|nr:hypothetical protein HDV05_004793 [Chytridiales sp. JEL 0842]
MKAPEVNTSSKMHEPMKGGIVKRQNKLNITNGSGTHSVKGKGKKNAKNINTNVIKRDFPLDVIVRILNCVYKDSSDTTNFLYQLSSMASISRARNEAITSHSAWKDYTLQLPNLTIPVECDESPTGYYRFIKKMWERLCMVCMERLRGPLAGNNIIAPTLSSTSGIPLREKKDMSGYLFEEDKLTAYMEVYRK